jgi:hypothetical protein
MVDDSAATGLSVDVRQDNSIVDSDQHLQTLLSEIRDEQRREAERARIRWTTLTVALVVATIIALPAIWSYLHHLLVMWF